MSDKAALRIAVVGCGHWGPNHVRVFDQLEQTSVVACCDLSEARLTNIRKRFPAIRTTRDYESLLSDADIDAVVIATPTSTHYKLVADALRAGKHVLVEKPLCQSAYEGEILSDLAEESGRVLMVGHVFLFNAGIQRLCETIRSGQLGTIQYLDAVRTNLGPIRGDVNSLYDLATHDISIFNYLLDVPPVGVSCLGRRITQDSVEDVCFTTIQYADGSLAHVHVSWLNPRKVRKITVVGSRQMAHWDDIDPVDTLRLYDKGLAEEPTYNSFGEFQCSLRNADMHVPSVPATEPLKEQAKAFVAWVMDKQPCGCGVEQGLSVVRTLEAAMESLANGGAMCTVTHRPPVAIRSASSPREHILAGYGQHVPARKAPKTFDAADSTEEILRQE